MIQLSVVIPLYNEEETLPELIKRLGQVLKKMDQSSEIIFIDDGSSDRTETMLAEYSRNDPRIKIIRFSRNFGHQAAVSAGIDYAAGESILIMDGDLQDPPELIPAMLAKFKEGYEVVFAVHEKRKEKLLKNISYLVFYRILGAISSGVKLPFDSGDFSLISRRVAAILKSMPERNRYIRGLRSWVGFKQVGIPFRREARFAGESRYTLRKPFKLAYDGIFSFSYFPITLVTVLGFLLAAVSFLGILVVLWFRLFTARSVPGFASTASVVLFLGGVQLLSLGILGEYIRRIYDETKNRPLYVIQKKVGFKN